MRHTLALPLAVLLSAPAAMSAPAGRGSRAEGPTASAETLRKLYDRTQAPRMAPLLSEAIRFPTVQKDLDARARQKAWLTKVATELGLVVRDKGLVTEVELTGPPGSKVLGLVVHGDVVPVEAASWSVPPFAGLVENGFVVGRGAADDKGPLVQALLALRTLKDSGRTLTHTIRLLVGSDEESDNLDIATYLKENAAPDYSLVLDSAFPVVVGEKAWNALTLTTPLEPHPGTRATLAVEELSAGLATSIVPDRAGVTLAGNPEALKALASRVAKKKPRPGTRLETKTGDGSLAILVKGRSAHAGVNIEGGRNALVSLAFLLEGELPPSGADDLLAFARIAGQDLHGTGLGLVTRDPLWGRYDVNVATIKPAAGSETDHTLTINLRRTPPLTGPQLRERLLARVKAFNEEKGAALVPGGFYDDEPLAFDPEGKLVKRLLAAYARATGKPEKPAISGGGTYAKRLPNAIAFGMWFPGKPYPGHDVDEKIPVADLHRGVHVLLEALDDLATGPPLTDPLRK